MDKDAAFMKAINDIITSIEGVQNTLGTTIERVIKIEEHLDMVERRYQNPSCLDKEDQENGEEEST